MQIYTNKMEKELDDLKVELESTNNDFLKVANDEWLKYIRTGQQISLENFRKKCKYKKRELQSSITEIYRFQSQVNIDEIGALTEPRKIEYDNIDRSVQKMITDNYNLFKRMCAETDRLALQKRDEAINNG